MSVRVVIAGGFGRMGQTLIETVSETPGLALHAITMAEHESSPSASPFSGKFTHDVGSALADGDVLIDFTVPGTIAEHAQACASSGAAWVLGTTGLDELQQAAVLEAAGVVPVCQAANFSSGVTLMLRLVELATRGMGEDTDLEVIEAHHRHKVDAPSGTALAIGKAMAGARGVSLEEHSVTHRDGITGARPDGAIGFSTIRGGDIVGDHTALFAADGERLEITHRASSRRSFARGACRAALWLAQKQPGLYGMQDVLGLAGEE